MRVRVRGPARERSPGIRSIGCARARGGSRVSVTDHLLSNEHVSSPDVRKIAALSRFMKCDSLCNLARSFARCDATRGASGRPNLQCRGNRTRRRERRGDFRSRSDESRPNLPSPPVVSVIFSKMAGTAYEFHRARASPSSPVSRTSAKIHGDCECSHAGDQQLVSAGRADRVPTPSG